MEIVLPKDNLLPGQQTSATAIIRSANGEILTDRSVSWSTIFPAATVDANGVVTAVNTGTSVLRASSEGKADTASVGVGLKFSQLASGIEFACAIATTDKKTYCWGANGNGQLGDGTSDGRNVPTPVNTDLEFTSIAAGEARACGLTATGAAWCWGTNPVQVAATLTFKKLDIGSLGVSSPIA